MKENLLLLGMAYPEISKKYGASICMAGATEDGELRRIYPVPFELFLRYSFHKREWVNYEVREKGDYRKESYKIFPESITHGLMVDYNEIRDCCKAFTSTIEDLKLKTDADRTSLGIIKPEIIDFKIKKFLITEKRLHLSNQQMLDGCKIPIENLEYKAWYEYRCGTNCTAPHNHKSMCLDTELGQLIRNIKHKYDTEAILLEKIKERFFTWMLTRDVYFMVGTHFLHPKSWMIISVLYPPKLNNKNESLKNWCL